MSMQPVFLPFSQNYLNMINKIINTAVKVLLVIALIFSLIAVLLGILGMRNSFARGLLGISHSFDDQTSKLTIQNVYSGYPAQKAGIQKGDIILSVNDVIASPDNIRGLFGDHKAGTSMKIEVKRGDKTLELFLTRQLLPLFERLSIALFILILPIVVTTYILVGLWAIFKEPSSITTIIAIICFSFSFIIFEVTFSVLFSILSAGIYQYAALFTIFRRMHRILFTFAVLSAGPSWTLFFLIFPNKHRLLEKRKYLTYSLVFSFPVFYIIFYILAPGLITDTLGYTFITFFLFLYLLSGIWLMVNGARNETDTLRKRQYKLILFGTKYGALALLAGLLPVVLSPWINPEGNMFFTMLTNIFFLISQIFGLILPFTFINSFLHKNILETESALKRAIRYITTSALMFLLYIILTFSLGQWMLKRLDVDDQAIMIIVILMMSITFSPLNNRVLQWIEKKLYPEKTEYKRLLRILINKMPVFIEADELLQYIGEWLADTMKINPAQALLIDKGISLPYQTSFNDEYIQNLHENSIIFWDEIPGIHGSISLSIPVIHHGDLMAIINIGRKKDNDDFNGDDIGIFNELSEHLAVALQNIKLQREYIDKKRMSEELKIASIIQRKLMPSKIPAPLGLNVEGRSIPWSEVGGDYFDIIPVSDSKTALVLADVSGKGTGAALLMSNLQAALKASLYFSQSLKEIVYKINNLVLINSLSSQFITFFIGIWNDEDKSLTYINAGQNPPILIRKCMTAVYLQPTGIALGFKKDHAFNEAFISLEKDDLIFIYSDGIEEYFNKDMEQYGINRIKQVLKNNFNNCPKHISKELMNDLYAFADGSPQNDDLTFIIAKIV